LMNTLALGDAGISVNDVEQLAGQVCSRWPEFFPCTEQDELALTRPISLRPA